MQVSAKELNLISRIFSVELPLTRHTPVLARWGWWTLEALVVLYLVLSPFFLGIGFDLFGISTFLTLVFMLLVVVSAFRAVFLAPRKLKIIELAILILVVVLLRVTTPHMMASGRISGFRSSEDALGAVVKDLRQDDERAKSIGKPARLPVSPDLARFVQAVRASRYPDGSLYVEFQKNRLDRSASNFIVFASEGQATTEMLAEATWDSNFPDYRIDLGSGWWSAIGPASAVERYREGVVDEIDK